MSDDRKIPDDIKRDRDAILHEANGLLKDPAKRRLFGNILTLGGLSIATGILIKDHNSIQNILNAMSRWNDGVQGTLFSEGSRAPVYPKSMINNPFRFNAFYPIAKAPVVDGTTYKLMLSGQINDKRPWTLSQLYALPGQVSQVTRHICVEGWSEIGEWGGPQLSTFLKAVGADLTCKYVGFKCADGYYESIDMPTALHPQTLMAFTFREHTIPTWYGYPFKIRMPTKLGYKNPKHVMEIFVTNDFPGGYWVDQGYNWFGGS